MRILISGGRSYVALELIRLLKHHDVYVLDSQEKYISQKSKYIGEAFLVSQPRCDFLGFKEGVLEIIENYNIEFFIPTSEEIFYISKFKKEIESKGCHFLGENFTFLKNLHSKYQITKICEGMGISIPKTTSIKSKEILEKKIGIGEYKDYVVKPEFSRFASQIVSNKFGNNELTDLEINETHNSYILQEYIKGGDICSYSILNKGDVVVHVSYRSGKRYKNGASITFTTYNDECNSILNFIKEFGRKTGFHGQISFDFKRGKDNIFLLECNPRATNGLHLFSGDKDYIQNLENILYDKPCIQKYILNKNIDKIHLVPLFVYIVMYFKYSLYKKIFRLQDDVVYDSEDKAPFFYQFSLLIYYIYHSFLKKKGITEIMTYDIEYDGQNLDKN